MTVRDLGKARRRPLAGILGSVFALSSQTVSAGNTFQVGNCNDAGPNSLRDVLSVAVSGDIVDLSLLTCTISLNTAQLGVGQESLTIRGSGANNLTIDASQLPFAYERRVFGHTGSGTLTLEDMKLTGGQSYHTASGYRALGGCVYSAGNLTLDNAIVTGCSAQSLSDAARGGGVYATGNLRVNLSSIYGNNVFSDNLASGGGAHSGGTMTVKYSTIDANHVYAQVTDTESTFKYARGGGLSSRGTVNIVNSTISHNTSNGSFAGIDASSSPFDADDHELFMVNSTVSGNQADKLGGGVYSNVGTVALDNSTIAFNQAGVGRTGAGPFQFFAPGLTLSAVFTNVSATLRSSLLSNNVYGSSAEFDLETTGDDGVNGVTFELESSANFIRTSLTKNPLPADTIRFSCPLLGLLRDNGGLTLTHALLSTSPAIDAGSNPGGWDEDQRHEPAQEAPFPYPRVSNGVADIGAYEVDQDEIVFNASFEGCPTLE